MRKNHCLMLTFAVGFLMAGCATQPHDFAMQDVAGCVESRPGELQSQAVNRLVVQTTHPQIAGVNNRETLQMVHGELQLKNRTRSYTVAMSESPKPIKIVKVEKGLCVEDL